jgi:hypothetical protein
MAWSFSSAVFAARNRCAEPIVTAML